MKILKFQYFLKFYITFFSILVLVSIAISIQSFINGDFEELLSTSKSFSTFLIFLLLGLNYEKIEDWLKLHWDKK